VRERTATPPPPPARAPAGKTTTVQMLTGALVPTAGRALLAGLDVETQQALVRRLVGYCPQVRLDDGGGRGLRASRVPSPPPPSPSSNPPPSFDALFDSLTVREHLELYARLEGVRPRAAPPRSPRPSPS